MELPNGNWNPKEPLSLERLKEIKNCNGVYLLSKAEKESMVEELLTQRLQKAEVVNSYTYIERVHYIEAQKGETDVE